MRAVWFVVGCMIAVPAVIAAASWGATWWYEHKYLPMISGDD